MINSGQVLMFSKTFCPYCTEAKNILASASVDVEVHELDIIPDGAEMQDALQEISKQRTVPNIFVAGQHIGGCSDLKAKIDNGKLLEIFDEAGIQYSL